MKQSTPSQGRHSRRMDFCFRYPWGGKISTPKGAFKKTTNHETREIHERGPRSGLLLPGFLSPLFRVFGVFRGENPLVFHGIGTPPNSRPKANPAKANDLVVTRRS